MSTTVYIDDDLTIQSKQTFGHFMDDHPPRGSCL